MKYKKVKFHGEEYYIIDNGKIEKVTLMTKYNYFHGLIGFATLDKKTGLIWRKSKVIGAVWQLELSGEEDLVMSQEGFKRLNKTWQNPLLAEYIAEVN